MLDRARRRAIEDKIAGIPCVGTLGLKILEADEGACRLSAMLDPDFGAILPGFHGGMLAMVADCAAWFAIVTSISPDEPLVTTHLNVQYLAPCLSDAIADARVVKIGRTLCHVNVALFETDGRPVATAQVTYARLANLSQKPPLVS